MDQQAGFLPESNHLLGNPVKQDHRLEQLGGIALPRSERDNANGNLSAARSGNPATRPDLLSFERQGDLIRDHPIRCL